MNEERYPEGTRVVINGKAYAGTSKGYKTQYNGEVTVIVALDNGQTEAVEERYLREATAEDENTSAALIARNEETQRRMEARQEAGRQRREELKAQRQQRKAEEEEAEEEAKRREAREYTEKMRRERAYAYGLESLLREARK